MEDKHRDILRRHSSLRKDLEPVKLLPFLVDVLDHEDEEKVKVKATQQEKIDELLKILPRKGPAAFEVFVNALQKVQPHLADLLVQESEKEEMKTELNRARTHSAKLGAEVRLMTAGLEEEQQKDKEELERLEEEIRRLYELVMEKDKDNKERIETRVLELEATIKRRKDEMLTEKSKDSLSSLERQESTRFHDRATSPDELAQLKFKDSARRTDVTGTHVLEICDDIGTCWHDLGIRLNLPTAILDNINVDHRWCREKAREMLYEWIKREGSSATVGSLADALEKIGNKRVAQKLLDFQQNERDKVPRDNARNTRSRTGNGDGNQGNASGVHYGNITISGPNSNVNFGDQQNIGDLYVTKKE